MPLIDYPSDSDSDLEKEKLILAFKENEEESCKVDEVEDEFEKEYRLLNESINESYEREASLNINNASFKSSPVSNFNSSAEEGAGEQTPFKESEANASLEDPALLEVSNVTEKVKNILVEHGLLTALLPSIDTNSLRQPTDSMKKKIENWTGLRDRGLFFNARLLNTHEFRNPLIMNKMLEFMKLNSHASNLSKMMYDPNLISSLPHYKDLVARNPSSSLNKYNPKSKKNKPQVTGKKRETPFLYSGPRKRI